MKRSGFDFNWLLVVLLCAFAVAPLFHPLYFWGAHDARHSVYFLVEFDRSFQEGILYPRWAPDFAFGYGYPIFNINAPLAYFIAEIVHRTGFGFVEAVKATFGLGLILSGLTMYLFARDAFGRGAGLLAAVIYVYTPYHLADIYVRGALAESFAFAFVPLTFWAVRRLIALGVPEEAGVHSDVTDPHPNPLPEGERTGALPLPEGGGTGAVLRPEGEGTGALAILEGQGMGSLPLPLGEGWGEGRFKPAASHRPPRPLLYSVIGGLALAALIMTHNQIAMFTAPLLAAYALYLIFLRAWRLAGQPNSGNQSPSRPMRDHPRDSLSLPGSKLDPLSLLESSCDPLSLWERVRVRVQSALSQAIILIGGWRQWLRHLPGGLWSQRRTVGHLLIILWLAVSVSAIFWLPMVTEMKFVRTDQWTTAAYDYRDHFVYLNQFFSPFWGFGVSNPGPDDGMPFQLGVIPVTLALLGLAGGRRRPRIEFVFFGLVTLAALFLMQPSSAFLWAALRGVAQLVQFPWRLLAVTVFSLAFLAGFAIRTEGRGSLAHRAALIALVVGTIWASYGYLSPQFIEPAEGPVSLAGLMRFQQSSGELVGLTAWNKVKPTESALLPVYLAGKDVTSKVAPESLAPGATAETRRHTTVLDEVVVRSAQGTSLTFYTQLYPGWKAYVDGTPVPIAASGDYGLITLDVPPGEHQVLLRFETTPSRVLGTVLTVLGLASVFGGLGWRRWRRAQKT